MQATDYVGEGNNPQDTGKVWNPNMIIMSTCKDEYDTMDAVLQEQYGWGGESIKAMKHGIGVPA